MSNIGYAIFKKTTVLIKESNGMFDALQLSDNIDTIIDNSIQLEVGDKLLFFKRIASKLGKEYPKDAYLVVLQERVKKDSEEFTLGSAICFKEFQIHEEKIIDGVTYLLNQLKRNFEKDYGAEDKDLGVILPSTNKDFNIFKDRKVVYTPAKKLVIGFDRISFVNDDTKKYLHHFCYHNSLQNIACLLLTPSAALLNTLDQKGYQKTNLKALTTPKEAPKKTIPKTRNNGAEIAKIRQELKNVTAEKDEIHKNRNLFRILSIALFCIAAILGILFMTNTVNNIQSSNDSSLYPIEDTFYISHDKYNVNVRNSPAELNNIETQLSDGDEVYVLGGIKNNPIWLKINYNDNKETGYITSRFISKKINTNRLEVLNETATINLDRTALYSFPQIEGKYNSKSILKYLDKDDIIFVKSKEYKRGWYSVQVTKNSKTYNGYLKSEDFD